MSEIYSKIQHVCDDHKGQLNGKDFNKEATCELCSASIVSHVYNVCNGCAWEMNKCKWKDCSNKIRPESVPEKLEGII